MFRKTYFILIICCVIEQSCEQSKFLLNLSPEQMMRTFDDVMSDDYMKMLAKQFASKAAQHFMEEINKQKHAMVDQLINKENRDEYEQGSQYTEVRKKKQKEYEYSEKDKQEEYGDGPPAKKTKHEVSDIVEAANEAATEAVKSAELDENKALRLIQDPSPDGDHQDSSGEISREEHKKIPVIQVTKINGIYFRRLLGMI